MIEQIKYINHLNEVIEFGKDGIFINYNTLRDYSWDITSANNKIASFKKGIVSKTIPVIIKCHSEEEGIKIRNRLFEVFEKDVLAKKNGRIVIGEYYLKCFITGSKKTKYLINNGYMHLSLTMKSDYPAWIKESHSIYRPKSALNTSESAEGREILIGNATNSILNNYGVYGRSEQQSYTGKNAVDLSTFSRSNHISNYTFDNEIGLVSFDFDGTYASPTFDCTYLAGKKVYAYLRNINNTNAELGTKYCYLQFTCTLSDGTIKYIGLTDSGVTLPTDVTYIGFGIYANNSASAYAGSLSANVMVSSEPSETYEKYVGGEASPNPSYPQDIESVGESKNLLEVTAISTKVDSLFFTVNADKSITLKGGSDLARTFTVSSNAVEAGDYILSSGVNLTGLKMDVYFEDGTSTGIVAGASSVDIHCTSQIVKVEITTEAKVKFDNFTFYPMLRKAIYTDDSYLPYGSYGLYVNTNNKNLVNPSEIEVGYISQATGLDWDVDAENGRRTPYIKVRTNTQYMTNTETAFRLFFYTENKEYISTTAISSGGFKTPSNCGYIRLHADIEVNPLLTTGFMLCEGTDATYVEHQSTKALIPLTDSLRGIKVSEGGNFTDESGQQWVCDTLEKYADGTGKLVQRVYHKVFDGTESLINYTESAGGGNRFSWYSTHIKGNKDINSLMGAMSNKLVETTLGYSWLNNVDCFCMNVVNSSNQGAIILRLPSLTNVTDTATLQAQLKEWYDAGEPMEVICEMANYIETPLTAEQISEIEKLQTFEGITYITNNDDAYQEVTYSIMQYLDFPYGYEYDFTADFDSDELLNTSFVPVDFRMVIHGAITNPSVFISGHEYNVDVVVEEGDYLTIDSQAKTIVLSKQDGTQVNCFNHRNRESYVFEKIPSGKNEITSAGDLNIDITLLDERSEPRWT